MTLNFKHTFSVIAVVVMTHMATMTFACTCIGKDKQTTETELNYVDLAIKGTVISVTKFDYYDTVGISFLGQKFDSKQTGYLIRKYKVFTLVVDNKFKTTTNLADTIQIVTGYGGGDCGYEFEVGKEYIVYGESWKEKIITVRHKRRKDKRRLTETIVANKFFTDICNLTQEANAKELNNLKHLTK